MSTSASTVPASDAGIAVDSLLTALWRETTTEQALWEGFAIVVCVALAWLLSRHVARWRSHRLDRRDSARTVRDTTVPGADPAELGELAAAAVEQRAVDAERIAREGREARPGAFDDVFFPVSLYCLLAIAATILGQFQATTLLHVVLLLTGAVAAVRLLGFLLGRLPQSDGLLTLQRAVVIVVGLGVVLHLLGQTDPLAQTLATMQLPLAGGISVLQVVRSVFWLAIALLLAYWMGSVLESRLLRVEGIDISLRIALARILRALLLLVAVMLGLSAVGIDMTALSVFSGALGVGIGLGLQRIASNYLSGLIILLERSIRPGDAVRVGGLEGTVTAIRTRYSLLKAEEGVEIVVPNEMLTGQTVHNVTTGGRLRRSARVQIAYGCKPEQVIGLLLEAIRGCRGVADRPAPTACVAGFGPVGLLFEFSWCTVDLTAGGERVASEVYRAVYLALLEAGFEIRAA